MADVQVRLPFPQTPEGCRALGGVHWPLEFAGGRVGVFVTRSRLVPGHFVLRVQKFGRGKSREWLFSAVSALTELARRRRVLRLHVEAWTEDADEMRLISDVCSEAGFKDHPTRSYRFTILMDLSRPEDEIFGSLHPTGRRHIRAPGKRGFEVRTIDSPGLGPRLASLISESFSGTGGTPPDLSWEGWIRLANDRPDLVHIVGLFRRDGGVSPDPLSFAVSVHHGNVVEYAHAGATRRIGGNLPLLYAPTWELIRWARSSGARWWDFGGITTDDARDRDSRVGISDFKRFFSRNVVPVGAEWIFEPRPGLTRGIGALKRILRLGD